MVVCISETVPCAFTLGIAVVLELPDSDGDCYRLVPEALRYPGSHGGSERLRRCALTAITVAVTSQDSQTKSQTRQACLHVERGHAGKYFL